MQEKEDKVNGPLYYSYLKKLDGAEVINITYLLVTRRLDFDLDNVVKYILRAGRKIEEGCDNKTKAIEDLKKAIFYINNKIKTLEDETN